MTNSAANLDLVIYGATGFTGRLVAERFQERYATAGGLRWALAGRSLGKLEAVRDAIGAPRDMPLIVATAEDPASLAQMARRTKAVLSTVGPYQLHGSALVQACAAAGVDYLDLCGETAWMRAMIDAHHKTAQATGARIVFSCGFDSVPFDLGVLSLQTAVKQVGGAALSRVKCRVLKMQGAFSGGTLASLRANISSAADPTVAALLRNPFALTPGFEGPAQPTASDPAFDEDLGAWVAPFVMADINTRNVHRSNFLMDQRYGADFRYDEMMVAGIGPQGEATAKGIAAMLSGLGQAEGPKPGEGPTKAEREAGCYELLFMGTAQDGQVHRTVVTGDRDPGYGSTSKIISEAALCLLRDVPGTPGGIWTPGALMGAQLTKRLVANAGLTFATKRL